MKKLSLLSFAFFALSLSFAQNPVRYFECKYSQIILDPNYPLQNWQDSVYVIQVSDPTMISEIMTELSIPAQQRQRHIIGYIDYGDGGFNRNTSHQFLWHFKLDSVQFAEISTEACDGLAHTDVDIDPTYWIGTLRQFCGWGYRVYQEIFPSEITKPMPQKWTLAPNPASSTLKIHDLPNQIESIHITDLTGRLVYQTNNKIEEISVDALPNGLYFLSIVIDSHTLQTQKFCVSH